MSSKQREKTVEPNQSTEPGNTHNNQQKNKTSIFHKAKKLKFKKPYARNPTAIAVALIFALVGSYLTFIGFADTVIGTLQAESLVGSGQIVTDGTASAGKILTLTTTAPASGTFTTSDTATSVTLRAKGTQCHGAPNAVVSIDGRQVLSAIVSSTAYTDYTAILASPIPAGSHSVSAAFTNPGGKGKCSRTLSLDVITALNYTPLPPASDTVSPTVTISSPASGATVNGLVNIIANATDNVAVTKAEFFIDDSLAATVTASPYNYSWDTANAMNASHILKVIAYDAAGNSSSANANVTVVGGTAVDLMSRKDFIYGSEIGAWKTDGKPAINLSTNIPDLVKAAKIPIIRFALFDCFSGMTCGTDNHAGTQNRTNFDTAINGITTNLNAEPWVKLVPIANDTIGTINGAVFCPSLNNLAYNLPFYKAVVDQAGNRVHIYESTNEAEYSCWQKWGYSGSGAVGVSTTLGNHFAQNMPALKKYAKTKGVDIKTVGYIGVSGGTGWGQTCTTPRLRAISEFNQATYQAYVNSGNDPDYIPNAESIHAYPHSPDFPNASDTCIFQYFKLFAQQWRQELVKIWGPTIGNQIKLSISEWEAGNLAWTGWTTASTVQSYYDGWFRYVLQGGALPDGSIGATERWWNANQFVTASDNNYYDMIKADGTTYPWYDTFKSASINDPNR